MTSTRTVYTMKWGQRIQSLVSLTSLPLPPSLTRRRSGPKTWTPISLIYLDVTFTHCVWPKTRSQNNLPVQKQNQNTSRNCLPFYSKFQFHLNPVLKLWGGTKAHIYLNGEAMDQTCNKQRGKQCKPENSAGPKVTVTVLGGQGQGCFVVVVVILFCFEKSHREEKYCHVIRNI